MRKSGHSRAAATRRRAPPRGWPPLPAHRPARRSGRQPLPGSRASTCARGPTRNRGRPSRRRSGSPGASRPRIAARSRRSWRTRVNGGSGGGRRGRAGGGAGGGGGGRGAAGPRRHRGGGAGGGAAPPPRRGPGGAREPGGGGGAGAGGGPDPLGGRPPPQAKRKSDLGPPVVH